MLHRPIRGPLAAALVTAVVTAASMAALAASAGSATAATAHNSQAGAYGPNTHTCAATPYFAAGGCASAAVLDDRRYPFEVPPSPDRPDRRLAYPGTPADAFGD